MGRLVSSPSLSSSALSKDEGILLHIHEEVRRSYLVRHQRLNSRLTATRRGVTPTRGAEPGEEQDNPDADVSAYLRLKQEVLDAERATVVSLRDSGAISDETLRRIQRDIDLEEMRIRSLEARQS